VADLKCNLIGGQWVTGDPRENINPSNLDEVVGIYAWASADDMRAAVAAAAAAFPAWSRSGVVERHAILSKVSAELLARREELGRLLAREEGKTLPEALGEVGRAAQIFDFYAGEVLRIAGELLPSIRPGVGIEVTREAVGVVGLITPWNFPLAIPAGKIAGALCYGNTIVFKPAELVPGSAWALVDILHRAGAPAGVINLVMGDGAIVGQALIDHPDVAAVSFTGGQITGKRVAQASVAHDRRFQLEMGGKNPLVILDDADLDLAVECAVNSAFYSTGQRCTAASRLIVTDQIHDRFVAAMIARLQTLVIGDALEATTHIGPVVDQSQLQIDLDYIEIGQREGARLAFGGDMLTRQHRGHYLAPALFTEARSDMTISREEIFGPVSCVIRVADYDASLAISNDTPFGLSAGIVTTSLKYAADFKRNCEAGMVMVNLPTAGIEFQVPFGGRKKSSYGARELGRYAADFFTITKTSYVKA
jgi:aldehyde dehydrogenase (NAD+)